MGGKEKQIEDMDIQTCMKERGSYLMELMKNPRRVDLRPLSRTTWKKEWRIQAVRRERRGERRRVRGSNCDKNEFAEALNRSMEDDGDQGNSNGD